MKRLCLLLMVALATSVVAAKPKKKKAPADQAVAVVTGKLICSHCELGVGKDCCSALQVGNTVFLLAGQANKELMPQRLNGGTRKVIGRLAKQEDQIQLTGVQLKVAKNDKKGYKITGRVTRQGKRTLLSNGKLPIRLTGKPVKGLQDKSGQLIEATGTLGFDLRGRLRLKTKSSQVVNKKPVIPPVKKKK